MSDSPPFQQIGIFGTGRVASALALGLAPHSALPLLVSGRSALHLRALVDRTGGTNIARDRAHLMAHCDVIALAVSDDGLDSVVAELAAQTTPIGTTRLIFHVSGRSGAALLAPLAAKGALTAAIHPVMTFTGDAHSEVRRMIDARFAVTGTTEQATTVAAHIVHCLGGVAIAIGEHHRALYHAALCHAANHLVTLLAGASRGLAVAGVEEPAALLAPLVRAALDNVLSQGFAALSGPLLRGDGMTIANHLSALNHDCPDLLTAYRCMALATIDELERSGGSPAVALRSILQSP